MVQRILKTTTSGRILDWTRNNIGFVAGVAGQWLNIRGQYFTSREMQKVVLPIRPVLKIIAILTYLQHSSESQSAMRSSTLLLLTIMAESARVSFQMILWNTITSLHYWHCENWSRLWSEGRRDQWVCCEVCCLKLQKFHRLYFRAPREGFCSFRCSKRGPWVIIRWRETLFFKPFPEQAVLDAKMKVRKKSENTGGTCFHEGSPGV